MSIEKKNIQLVDMLDRYIKSTISSIFIKKKCEKKKHLKKNKDFQSVSWLNLHVSDL